MNNMWDQRYAVEDYVYGEKPNSFFKENLLKYPVGKLLLPAEGEGRNAVFAALSGWDVTAFDSSEVGKAKAEKLSKKHGVSISYLLASHEDVILEAKSFDMLALIYAHSPFRQDIHKKILRYLKPGGTILIEGFSKEQIKYNTGGPGRIDMLFSKKEINSDFSSLAEVDIRIEEVELDEGEFHQGKASVLRMIGKK
ncbi:class I SAM-dependent methyltransferase [Bacteroidota bacterium]